MSRGLALYTIAAGKPFVDALAAGVMAGALGIEAGDPLALSRLTILLPTRRACRALIEAFLRRGGGAPMLLPRIAPLGEVDEDLLEAGAEISAGAVGAAGAGIPPAIPELRRRLLLARLIVKRGAAQAQPCGAEEAVLLAGELARLLDQVQTERLSFDRLADLVPDDFARHWQLTLEFLRILTEHWPAILAGEGCVDPAARRNLLLEARARSWAADPPADPVIAAGSTGSLPATADLLAVIAGLPRGAVVLPGLDRDLDDDAWQAVDETHPQYAMARLLARLDLCRGAVKEWVGEVPAVNPARAALVGEALRPAETTEAWRRHRRHDGALRGVTRIDCPAPREEAGVIALAMREALETPGKRAALVTPDRALARRVAAELRRWDIDVDDSAGTPLSETVPGTFLRLAAAMVAERFAPLPLLGALKHPFAAGGMAPKIFRRRVRELEGAVLRGPRPAAGLDGLRATLATAPLREEKTRRVLDRWLAGLGAIARPFAELIGRDAVSLPDLAAAHAGFAEALAMRDDLSGGEVLWAGEAGAAAAAFLAELLDAARDFPPLAGAAYPALLDALMADRVVRPRFGRHPRLFIWGPLEARLQHVDRMILGGLNEGTWPPEARTDPWMSRPMRGKFGLPQPERRIGLSAHDFAQAFCAPEVMLTRATRVAGVPTVPSRWLLRLRNLLPEKGGIADGVEYRRWFESLDRPPEVRGLVPPMPRPPVSARPRRLSVTEIETLIRDPYAIFARRVLGLEPLDPLDGEPGAAERGSFIHLALDRFLRAHRRELPDDAPAQLLRLGEEAFGDALSRPGVRAFWWPRFQRIAEWFVVWERARRAGGTAALATEVGGTLAWAAPAGVFTLAAKADRIDRLDGGPLAILDYKTGQVPTRAQVKSGLVPQLTLEAAIAAAGGFTDVPAAVVGAIAYVRLTGRAPAGEEIEIGDDVPALAAAALAGLKGLIAAFDRAETPYRSRPRPMFARQFGSYDHLARVKEWSSGLEAGE